MKTYLFKLIILVVLLFTSQAWSDEVGVVRFKINKGLLINGKSAKTQDVEISWILQTTIDNGVVTGRRLSIRNTDGFHGTMIEGSQEAVPRFGVATMHEFKVDLPSSNSQVGGTLTFSRCENMLGAQSVGIMASPGYSIEGIALGATLKYYRDGADLTPTNLVRLEDIINSVSVTNLLCSIS